MRNDQGSVRSRAYEVRKHMKNALDARCAVRQVMCQEHTECKIFLNGNVVRHMGPTHSLSNVEDTHLLLRNTTVVFEASKLRLRTLAAEVWIIACRENN